MSNIIETKIGETIWTNLCGKWYNDKCFRDKRVGTRNLKLTFREKELRK